MTDGIQSKSKWKLPSLEQMAALSKPMELPEARPQAERRRERRRALIPKNRRCPCCGKLKLRSAQWAVIDAGVRMEARIARSEQRKSRQADRINGDGIIQGPDSDGIIRVFIRAVVICLACHRRADKAKRLAEQLALSLSSFTCLESTEADLAKAGMSARVARVCDKCGRHRPRVRQWMTITDTATGEDRLQCRECCRGR